MNKVLIVVDSTCDLSKELIEANDLRIIPLSVNFSEEIYYDGKDITTEKLYQLVAEKGVLPHTAFAAPRISLSIKISVCENPILTKTSLTILLL